MKRIPSGLSRRGFLGSAAGAGAAAALGAAPPALAADRAPAAADVPWLP
ncbi:twin-arginine translocation signal domain-containing protein, partial [Actinacidiphila alni]